MTRFALDFLFVCHMVALGAMVADDVRLEEGKPACRFDGDSRLLMPRFDTWTSAVKIYRKWALVET